MVRKRKNDTTKEKNEVGPGNSPKQRQRPPEETSKSTAEDMHYVSNSRSRARVGSPVASTRTLRWFCRLRIVRLFFVALVIGGLGFAVGRFVHKKMNYSGLLGRRLSALPGMPHDHSRGNEHGKEGRGTGRPYGYIQSMKELDERHAAQHAAAQNYIDKQSNQNLPNMPNDNVHHVKPQPGVHVQQPLAAKQQHVFQQPQAAHQQHAAHQQAAQNQNGVNQQPAPQQHVAQQDTAKQQHAANQQPQQHNAQQPQPVAQLQQPVPEKSKLPQAAAKPLPQQQGIQKQSTDLHPKSLQVQDSPSDINSYPYHIIQSLTNTHKMPHLKQRFIDCMTSILDKASINLHFFFVVDKPGREFITETLQKFTDEGVAKNKFQFHFMDVEELARQIAPLVSMLQAKVSGGHPYFQDVIFFLSVALHKGILPDYVHRVIMLDTDLKFMTNIKELFDYFGRFTGDNIMGLAREMQPVYRHMLSLYRSKNKGTKVGDPPPNGLTGFNSGVFLLDLDKIKASAAYHGYINAEKIAELTSKYFFKGHLGDQDFYSLISLDKVDLFYTLPCSWNRQLCTWWRDKGYADVFDLYFTCNEKIHVYHGNCNTPIPQ